MDVWTYDESVWKNTDQDSNDRIRETYANEQRHSKILMGAEHLQEIDLEKSVEQDSCDGKIRESWSTVDDLAVSRMSSQTRLYYMT